MSDDLLAISERALKAAQVILESGVEGNDVPQVLAGLKAVVTGLELTKQLRAEAGQSDTAESRDFEAEVEALLAINAGYEKRDGMSFPDSWSLATGKLRELASNGPEKTAWKDPDLHGKAMSLLSAAGAALAVWGNPSTIVPGIASGPPTEPGDASEIEEAVVVPETVTKPQKPTQRSLPRHSGPPGPISVGNGRGRGPGWID